MQPGYNAELPNFSSRRDVLRHFSADSTGVLSIECSLCEAGQSRYLREISWSSGNFSASVVALTQSGQSPALKSEAHCLDLSFSHLAKKLPPAGTVVGAVKFRLAFSDLMEANGALRSFATSVVNGTDFESAIQEVRDSFARFGVKNIEIESNLGRVAKTGAILPIGRVA